MWHSLIIDFFLISFFKFLRTPTQQKSECYITTDQDALQDSRCKHVRTGSCCSNKTPPCSTANQLAWTPLSFNDKRFILFKRIKNFRRTIRYTDFFRHIFPNRNTLPRAKSKRNDSFVSKTLYSWHSRCMPTQLFLAVKNSRKKKLNRPILLMLVLVGYELLLVQKG